MNKFKNWLCVGCLGFMTLWPLLGNSQPRSVRDTSQIKRVIIALDTTQATLQDTASSDSNTIIHHAPSVVVQPRPNVPSRNPDPEWLSTPEEVKREIIIGVEPGVMEFPPGRVKVDMQDFHNTLPALRGVLARYRAQQVIKAFPNFNATSDSVRYAPKLKRNIVLNDYSRVYKLRLPPGADRNAVCEDLKQLSGIRFAEPNGIVKPNFIPNDKYFGNNGWPGPQWNLTRIRAPEAWDLTLGSTSTLIAILDGGIHTNDSDLSGKVTGDQGTSSVPKWESHGTAVASIAAAYINNANVPPGYSGGIAGVDGNATLLSKRIDPGEDWTLAANKVLEAIADGADIINYSAGNDEESILIRQAFADAYRAGVVNVASMGNDNTNQVEYPAVYEQHMLSVGSVDNASGDPRWETSPIRGSNFGPHIDIVAPGGDGNIPAILVSGGGTYYDKFGGTSAAAPHVSGVAGLMLAYYKQLYNADLTNEDIYEIIKRSAEDIHTSGFDETSGYGLLDARNALDMLTSPYELSHQLTTGTDVGSVSLTMTLKDVPGLTTDVYQVIRHEIRQTINFGITYQSPPAVWGNPSTVGFSAANPNPGLPWCAPVPGSITTTGCEMRTFVYEVFDDGQSVGWFPASPSQAVMHYSVHGQRADPLVNGNFEDGSGANLTGWTATGPWQQDNTVSYTWGVEQIGQVSSHCAGTHQQESATGTLISSSFKVSKRYLNFCICGHNGQLNSDQHNKIELQDMNGNVLRRSYTPGSDALVPYTWDLQNYQGQMVRLVCIDNHTGGGWAWIGVDGFALSDNNMTTPSGEVSGGGGGGAVPSPWVSADVGNVSITGDATYNNGTFTVEGSGQDIWDYDDAFHFVHQPLSGNGSISARIISMENTHAWAKVGVMIRESVASNSPHAMMVLTPGNGAIIQGRSYANGNSAHPASTSGGIPRWVKIERSGNTFTGYVSNNSGSSWDVVGTMTASMGNNALMGLCATSPSSNELNTTVFDNVSINGSGGGGGGGNSIVNGSFDDGLNGWTKTGTWQLNGAWTLLHDPPFPQPGQMGDFAGSYPPENGTGTLTSSTFTIDQMYLNFRIGGQDNANANKVRLVVGGNVVKEVGPPNDNGFVPISWLVDGWSGQSAYIECVDGNSNGGYAWFCVDEFQLSSSPTTGVTKPAILVQDTPVFRSDLPDTFTVAQNVPNPFNPETTIGFALPRASDVQVVIYNVLGQEVRRLVDTSMKAGRHKVVWDSKDALGQVVSSGVYFYRFVAGPIDHTQKMLILK